MVDKGGKSEPTTCKRVASASSNCANTRHSSLVSINTAKIQPRHFYIHLVLSTIPSCSRFRAPCDLVSAFFGPSSLNALHVFVICDDGSDIRLSGADSPRKGRLAPSITWSHSLQAPGRGRHSFCSGRCLTARRYTPENHFALAFFKLPFGLVGWQGGGRYAAPLLFPRLHKKSRNGFPD